MASQHGKWTLSDSDDDDDDNNIIPPKDTRKLLKNLKADPEPKSSPVNSLPKPKSKPRKEHNVKLEPEKTAMVSEAGQATRLDQSNPGKYDSSPSPALKRKRESDEGGWNLSSSDDEDNGAPSSAPKNKPKPKPSSSSPLRKKWGRSPSPHGDNYYKEEPSDFFEANLKTMSDMYRFYLNKVTGIEKKYNTGALHIKGKDMKIRDHVCVIFIRAARGYTYSFFSLLSVNRNTFPHVWHTKGICPGTFLFYFILLTLGYVTWHVMMMMM